LLAFLRAVLAIAMFGVAGAAAAAPTACPQSYLGGQAPQVTNPATVIITDEVCYTLFAVAYSGPRRVPGWSAVRLTKAMADGADVIDRIVPSPYHDEPEVDAADRSTDPDYDYSGYDRGHMTPADDMPTYDTQRETFTMANMVPQRGGLNSGLWRSLEGRVQKLASADGEIFVVTGPVFGPSPALVNGRVAIPAYTFKAVYSPKSGVAAGYLATNEEKPVCWALPISRLETIVALDLFPTLTPAVKGKLKGVPKAPGKCAAKGWVEPV
jgi:endonuclease G